MPIEPENLSILIVDDERDLREVIHLELEMFGYKIFEAGSGNEALSLCKDEKIDVIISDIRMPDGDGMHLLTNVKKSHPQIPVVILMTGYSEYAKDDLLQQGATAFFEKPLDCEEINDFILKACDS